MVLAGSLTACGATSYSRHQVRDRFVSTWQRELQLSATQAQCLVDRWFAHLSDAELAPLTRGAALTDAELAVLGQLALDCGIGANQTPGAQVA